MYFAGAQTLHTPDIGNSGVTVVPSKTNSKLGGPFGSVKTSNPSPLSQPNSSQNLPAAPQIPANGETETKASGGGVFGGQAFKDVQHNKFMSKFVASGSTGTQLSIVDSLNAKKGKIARFA